MFTDLTNMYVGFFGGHCLKEVFQTLHDYYLAWGLAIHARCDDLISKSQVRQNLKLRIVFVVVVVFLHSSPL